MILFNLFRIIRFIIIDFHKLSHHRRVAFGQFFNGYVLCFIIGMSKVFISTKQRFFGFLKMVNGIVDLLNSRLELLGCQFVIAGEATLEPFKLVLEVRDINVL